MKKLLLALLCYAPAVHAIELGLPVACDIGKECFVQNYVDNEPGPEHRDYRCGPLSYPNHRGTDIRIPTLREMQTGSEVIAAADGVVSAIRDGEEDRLLSEKGKESVANKECGNAVVVQHPDQWQTMYCHLRRGSVAVKKGDAVKAGQVLGLIGLSGSTEFPHLHFQVSQARRVFDPFSGQLINSGCGKVEKGALWNAEALEKLSYRDGGLVVGGFTTVEPTLSGIVKGEYQERTLAATAPAIIFWAESYGLHKGDVIALTLTGPDGKVLVENEAVQPKNQAVSVQMLGKRNHEKLATGNYHGRYTVTRGEDKRVIVEYQGSVEVK